MIIYFIYIYIYIYINLCIIVMHRHFCTIEFVWFPKYWTQNVWKRFAKTKRPYARLESAFYANLDTMNFKELSNRCPSHVRCPSVPLKHTVDTNTGIQKKNLGMKLVFVRPTPLGGEDPMKMPVSVCQYVITYKVFLKFYMLSILRVLPGSSFMV